MSDRTENRMRDVLAERSADIAPPEGWEDRVLSAGRRRRTRRRVGAVVGAAAAVALVVLVTGTVTLPRALSGYGPAGPSGTPSQPTDPDDLPEGSPSTYVHATTDDLSETQLYFGDSHRSIRGYLTDAPKPAGNGVVATTLYDNDQLVFIGGGDTTTVLQRGGYTNGFAVSPDGTHVAWVETWEDDRSIVGTLQLAELPSGDVVESREIGNVEAPGAGTPEVRGFYDGAVVLGYEGAQSPYVWDPEKDAIAPMLGTSYAAKQGGLADLSVPGDTILLTRKGCVRNLSLAEPERPERWEHCGLGEVRISPDGSMVAGHGIDSVWVRELDTGKLLWKKRFSDGIDLGDTIDEREIVSGFQINQLEWESSGTLLLTYGDWSDLDMESYQLLRCVGSDSKCERVPTENDVPVMTLGTD